MGRLGCTTKHTRPIRWTYTDVKGRIVTKRIWDGPLESAPDAKTFLLCYVLQEVRLFRV